MNQKHKHQSETKKIYYDNYENHEIEFFENDVKFSFERMTQSNDEETEKNNKQHKKKKADFDTQNMYHSNESDFKQLNT